MDCESNFGASWGNRLGRFSCDSCFHTTPLFFHFVKYLDRF